MRIMPSAQEKPIIRVAPNNPVFDLPVIVAIEALEPRELLRAFVRYKHVDYYDPALFTRTYDWMKARGLTEGGSDHAALVG